MRIPGKQLRQGSVTKQEQPEVDQLSPCTGLTPGPQIYTHLEPQNVTLFGNTVLADKIRGRTKGSSHWIQVGSKAIENTSVGDRREHKGAGGRPSEVRSKDDFCCHKPTSPKSTGN